MSLVEFYYEKEEFKPYKKFRNDAGFDLKAKEDVVIYPHTHKTVSTGVKVVMSPAVVGFIKPRSGLSAKFGLDVLAGVIDSEYRGEIKVVIMNNSAHSIKIIKGMRIAQFVPLFVAALDASFTKGNPSEETIRGNQGFGSTGI